MPPRRNSGEGSSKQSTRGWGRGAHRGASAANPGGRDTDSNGAAGRRGERADRGDRGGGGGDRGGRGGRNGRGGRGVRGGRGGAGSQERRPGVCQSFARTGTCSFGDRCWYSHGNGNPQPRETGAHRRPEASRNVSEFASRVENAVQRQKFTLKLDDPRDRDLWIQLWAAVAVGAEVASGPALLRALMRLPDSSAIAPPAFDVLRALAKIVDAASGAKTRREKTALVDTLEIVADTVEKRLLHHEADILRGLRASCAETANELRQSVHGALLSVMGDLTHSERASRLLCKFLELLKRYQTELERVPTRNGEGDENSALVAAEEAPWAGWRSATLSWLQRGTWLDAPPLLTQYESVEKYAETLRQLVTMLTFYWGAGALFPKCRHRGRDDRPCDQPLCAYVVSERSKACGRKLFSGETCSAPVKWRCARHGHDAACDRCLQRLQSALVGKPGSRASTDVYDAVVERETRRRDGFVYIVSQLTSRRPPSINPNWRTTYRLKCSALVAVVRLGVSCEPLSPMSRIEWAEVVPVNQQGGAAPDFMERSKGRLALRLLSRADLSTLKCDVETLEAGTRLALIDLQVFVPEVLSVLSTVTDPALVDHLNQLPFSKGLIGAAPTHRTTGNSDTIESAITEALATTEIELVTKLPDVQKRSLTYDLIELARSTNLYGTQLEAFTAALSMSLHCTQGPPGTGKSYVGVVLIHALDTIRQYAIAAGNAVGPIVVLSYKNHALDELLIDVLNGHGKRSGIHRGLIRCGKSEDLRLTKFGERSSPAERAAQEVLGSRVACVRSAQRTLRDWRNLRAALYTSATDDELGYELRAWQPIRAGNDDKGMKAVKVSVMQAVRLGVRIDGLDGDPDSVEAYALLESMMKGPFETRGEDERAILREIAGLDAGMEHWLEPFGSSRAAFLLESWLCGSMPPPRCVAANEYGGCVMQSTTPGAYCVELHDCKYPNDCKRRRIDGLVLCEIHRCKIGGEEDKACQLPRLGNSEVCYAHACQVCVQSGCAQVYPRIGAACREHTCRFGRCGEMYVTAQLPFCSQHCCDLCQFVAASRGSEEIKSVRRVGGSKFCREHKCTVAACRDDRIFDQGPQDYCVMHACDVCDGKRNHVDPAHPPTGLCSEHRCTHVNELNELCPAQRDDDSNFCDTHTCRVCRVENLPLERAVVDRPPRNVCLLHPLCVQISRTGWQCNERTSCAGSEYCEKHIKYDAFSDARTGLNGIVMQCEGFTRKGKKCKTKGYGFGGSSFYCCPHFDQKPESSSETDDDEDMEDDDDLSDVDSSGDEASVLEQAKAQGAKLLDFWNKIGGAAGECPAKNEESVAGDANMIDVEIQCAGVTAENERCEMRGRSSNTAAFYCGEHFHQKPSSSHETKDDEDHHIDVVDVDDDSNEANALSQPLVGDDWKADKNIADDEESNVSSSSIAPQPVVEYAQATTKLRNQGAVEGALEGLQNFEVPVNDGNGSDVESATLSEDGKERVAFGMCVDELDDVSEDSESSVEEVPEHEQHLLDIVGRESTSGSESDEESGTAAPDEDEGAEICSGDPKEWIWDKPLSARWRTVAEYLRGICGIVAKLAVAADDHVERARRERAEAAAYSFKNARLIGATVVGATRRLHALRASEPFAMVVEEACEVMEPTLVSVLAVGSLRKLELIGDHRQLPAFVQQCWFAIQTTHPSIKVSLFERLVTSGAAADNDADVSTCTILDVQRRMRPEICELTRCEYADVVEIEDDDCTVSQNVGDRNDTPTMHLERGLWHGEGRFVPGIKQQVFFWDLETKEGRAAVGLSRCNYGEAEACAGLVSWLLHCGVPSGAITVITPYKGQKMTILKELRKYRAPKAVRRVNYSSVEPQDVMVSTVDRYQGDENDIVILSLVCTRPGNRFVALRNRFIVATSRARIGFFILGASDAVAKSLSGRGGKDREGPKHWVRLLKDLEHPGTTAGDDEGHSGEEDASRIGRKLTICCPRHAGVVREVATGKEFPQSAEELSEFCTELCPILLPWCSHPCQVKCHPPTIVPHTSRCEVSVLRPCTRHADMPLLCCEVRLAKFSDAASLVTALETYECDVMVEYRRPDCPHFVELPCHQYSKLLDGMYELPLCTEKVEDYVHPSCGHRRVAPACHQRRNWEDAPPPCHERVEHKRPCNCIARMSCHESVRESSLDKPPMCREAVSEPRPRCSHVLASRCYEAVALRELWSEQDGEGTSSTPPVVVHGTEYGPSETALGTMYPDRLNKQFPLCRISTTYRMSCDHNIKVLCSEAFELASGARNEGQCKRETDFASPICGHHISAECWVKTLSTALPPSLWVHGIDSDGNEETIADENALNSAPPMERSLKKLSGACGQTVVVMRKCGHKTQKLPCSKLFSILDTKKLPPCRKLMSIQRSCGHAYKTPCHCQGDPPPTCNEPVDDVFTYPCGNSDHSVRPGTCSKLTLLQGLFEPKCPIEVSAIRARCTHAVNVSCHLEKNVIIPPPGCCLDAGAELLFVEAGIDYCEAAVEVADCLDRVVYRRLCGHEDLDIPCSRAFEWAASPDEAPPCQQLIEIDSPLCDHPLRVACNRKEAILEADPWDGTPPQRITQRLDGDAVTCPVVVEDQQVPIRPSMGIISLLQCGRTTRFQRKCGHEDDIACETVFKALDSKCEHTECIVCEVCGNEADGKCHELKENAAPRQCMNLVEKKCSVCDINVTKVECFKEVASCEREVFADLPCGHLVAWTCGEGDPRDKLEAEPCLVCTRKQWIDALNMCRSILKHQEKSAVVTAHGESGHLVSAAEDRQMRDTGEILIPSLDMTSLLGGLRNRSLAILPPSSIKAQVELGPASLKSLPDAYLQILKCNTDLLAQAIANDSSEGLSVRAPLEIADVQGAYDIVYHVLLKTDGPSESFKLVDTQYGFGARATILSTESLLQDCNMFGTDGLISIVVGAALRHQILEDTPPFRLERKEIKKKTKRKKQFLKACEKADNKARKIMQQYAGKGFDHVSRDATQQPFERVYWVPGAVVPLWKLDIQFHRICGICFDDTLPSKGWVCPDGHFLCRGCFFNYVKQARAPDAMERAVDVNGTLFCPHDGCRAMYEPLKLLSQPHDAEEEEINEVFAELQELRMSAHAKQKVSVALETQKMKLEAEFLRVQQIQDIDQRQAEIIRLEIVDKILTLRCPKQDCRMAFVDFDGCFALKCSNCRTHFCAWCIDHSDPFDVHHHVSICPHASKAGYYHSLDVFNEHQRKRRKQLVINRLNVENAEVRERTLKRLQVELKDLAITISPHDFS